MNDALNTLPTMLRDAALSVLGALAIDPTDPRSCAWKCQTASYALARAVNALVVTDEDGDRVHVSAHPAQLFDPPAAIADNEGAHGHYVVRVEWDLDEYCIDLTAAQFAPLYSGPRVTAAVEW